MELVMALFGGGAVAMIIQYLLKYLKDSKEMTLSNEEKLRQELQEQIDDMKAEIKELRGEVNVWKQKYFELYEEHIQLKTRLSN